jgi:hypothetical protein
MTNRSLAGGRTDACRLVPRPICFHCRSHLPQISYSPFPSRSDSQRRLLSYIRPSNAALSSAAGLGGFREKHFNDIASDYVPFALVAAGKILHLLGRNCRTTRFLVDLADDLQDAVVNLGQHHLRKAHARASE